MIITALSLEAPVALIVSKERLRFTEDIGEQLKIVRNSSAELGLGSSLALAAKWAMECSYQTLCVVLADMPLVSGSTLIKLANAASQHSMSACRYPSGRCGVPACFGAANLQQLAHLNGAAGASGLLRALDEKAIVSPDPAELMDVDTPEELAAVEKLLLRAGD